MESIHYLLMKTNSMFSRRIMAEAGKVGLTPGQPKILDFLLQRREADQKTIASYCEIEQTTVGSILLRMEKAGLILRVQHEGNRRSLYVSLTEKGMQAAQHMADIFKQEEQKATAGLTPEQRGQLAKILETMCDTMAPDGKKA